MCACARDARDGAGVEEILCQTRERYRDGGPGMPESKGAKGWFESLGPNVSMGLQEWGERVGVDVCRGAEVLREHGGGAGVGHGCEVKPVVVHRSQKMLISPRGRTGM